MAAWKGSSMPLVSPCSFAVSLLRSEYQPSASAPVDTSAIECCLGKRKIFGVPAWFHGKTDYDSFAYKLVCIPLCPVFPFGINPIPLELSCDFLR